MAASSAPISLPHPLLTTLASAATTSDTTISDDEKAVLLHDAAECIDNMKRCVDVHGEVILGSMVRDGASEFVELGPGKVLQGLARRTDRSIPVRGVDTYSDLKETVRQ